MEQFGKYSLVRKIGSGGMAEVYLARTTVAQGLTKTLVIKKIHSAYARSRQFVTMFVDEAKIALGLNHPNIIQVFDFGAVGDTYFLAMEYVEGFDLLRLLQEASRQKRRVPFGLSAHIVQQVCKGLDYAHRKTDEFGEPLGIVHRDISPQNVLLSWEGSIKIVDFGIARARDVHEEPGVIKGKFSYMSPEQARGEPVDCRSDVFAAGIVLYELVCGRPLFAGKGKEALELVRAGAIPSPREHAADIPTSLEAIILKALAFHREDRFPSAKEFQHELGRFQLEWGHAQDQLIDSGLLAHTLAELIPPPTPAQTRLANAAPLTEEASLQGAQGAQGPMPTTRIESGRQRSHHEARDTGSRVRKYIYVLQGILRGIPALERRIGTEAATQMVEQFLQVARDIAFKHEAIVERPALSVHEGKTHPGDTGIDNTLRVVVGLPLAAEDDAKRAIRLGLALIDALDGIGSDIEPELRLALAIQRGTALVSPGHQGRRPNDYYEVEDATVGFAQRLASQAQGAEILVGGRVYRATRADWNYEILPSIEVIDEAVTHAVSEEETDPGIKRARVYRLRGRRERHAKGGERQPPIQLQGRQLELKALRDTFRDACVSRAKRMVAILGDAGVGKRTLVRTLLHEIGSDAIVVRTAIRVGTALTPYGVVADLAREVLGLAEDAEPHEVERRILRTIPSIYAGDEHSHHARAAIQIFSLLLGATGAAALAATRMDGDARRAALMTTLGHIEQALEPHKPLVIIGEDVHWADSDSLDVFADLLSLSGGRPVLIVLTSRPDNRITKLLKDHGGDAVMLDELDEPARRAMLREKFIEEDATVALADEILAKAGGNPFFINEILDTLLEQGVLAQVDQPGEALPRLRWVRKDVTIVVPSTIEDLLVTRIDLLPPGEKEALTYASVLGRHINAAHVSLMVGRPVRLELDELVKRGLLAESEGEYRFKNDMTMSVAYGTLPQDARIAMHRQVAQRISSASSYRQGQDDALIARHLELAGDTVAAADRYGKAATHALSLGGLADAFRLLARVLQLLPPAEQARRYATHCQREEILRRLGKRAAQLRELQNMRLAAEALALPGPIGEAHAALARFYIEVGKAAAAARALAPAQQYARDAGDRLAEAEALRLRSEIARMVGNPTLALQHSDEALRLVAAIEQDAAVPGADANGQANRYAAALEARARLLGNRGSVYWHIGKLEAATEAFAESLVIYRGLAMPRLEASALGQLGQLFLALGEYQEALTHYTAAIRIHQQLGDRSTMATALSNLGLCYVELGDYARADRHLGQGQTLANQTSNVEAQADIAVALGQLALRRGDVPTALGWLDQGRQLATEHRSRYHEIRAMIYTAYAHLLNGRPDIGLDFASAATQLAKQIPMRVGIVYGLTLTALAMAQLGRPDAAKLHLDEAAGYPIDESRPAAKETLLRWQAECESRCGLAAEATTTLARAELEAAAKAAKLVDPQLRSIFAATRSLPV